MLEGKSQQCPHWPLSAVWEGRCSMLKGKGGQSPHRRPAGTLGLCRMCCCCEFAAACWRFVLGGACKVLSWMPCRHPGAHVCANEQKRVRSLVDCLYTGGAAQGKLVLSSRWRAEGAA